MNSKHTAEHTCILLAFLKELASSEPYVSSIMHGQIVSVYQTIQPITMVYKLKYVAFMCSYSQQYS